MGSSHYGISPKNFWQILIRSTMSFPFQTGSPAPLCGPMHFGEGSRVKIIRALLNVLRGSASIVV